MKTRIRPRLLSAVLVALSLVAVPAAADTFVVRESITIDVPQEEAFCFAGNPANDVAWRSEVNTMTADGPWAVGTTYYEDSTLGFNPSYVTVTELVVLDAPTRMVVQTPADSLFLRAERTFERLSATSTRFTYRLEVDTRMPRDATGLPLPTWLVRWHYSNVMRRYQRKLERLLENAPTGACGR